MPNETYKYDYVFDFEHSFDIKHATIWSQKYWKISFLISTVYVFAIFIGQELMKKRNPYNLRPLLVGWNLLLAVFSIFGFARMLPEFWHSCFTNGVVYSYCINNYVRVGWSWNIPGFWGWLFTLSKVVELGDTVFIVLRKQPLLFLHWYHHITVLMFTWYSFKDHTGSARWFAFMNFTVHSLMYSYYAIRSMNIFRIPKSIPFIITCAQLTQMVFGILIIFGSYFEKLSGRRCDQSYENLNLSLLMYTSYFVLFAQYFHKSYYGGGKFATVPMANGQEKLKKIE